MKKSFSFYCCLLFLSVCHADIKVLMIGNSYTGQIKSMLKKLFEAQQSDVEFEFITPGGKTLKYHVAQLKTLERIKQSKCDILVLQDQSQTPALPGTNKYFHQAVDDFDRMLKGLEKKPKVFFYMTWGRRDGDTRNSHIFPDFSSMQKALSDNYNKAAKRIGAEVVPVGLGFEHIHHHHKDLFMDLYKKDGSHPSSLGAYLAASMFYSKLLGQDPESMTWNANFDQKTSQKIKSTIKSVLKEK